MKTTIFQFEVKNVLKLWITGQNEGRLERYRERLEWDVQDEGLKPNEKILYRASRLGDWKFPGLAGCEEVIEASTVEQLPVFFETRYQVHCKFQIPVESARVMHVMRSVADEFDYDKDGRQLCGPLSFINQPGRFVLNIRFDLPGGKSDFLEIEWFVVSEKMDVLADYREIVDKVESASPGMIYAFLSKTQNTAGLDAIADQPDAMWNDIFKKYADKYMRACSWVVQRPHVKYSTTEFFLKADRIKRWTPQLANKYQATPEARRPNAYFRTEEVVPEMDSVENRFVKFTMREISRRLKVFAEQCRQHQNVVSDAFREQIEAWQASIDKMYRHPAFKGVGKFTGLKQESLALQRKPGYAQIYETWIILRHAISVSEQGLNVGYRPIWKLYELWCFIVILDILREHSDLTEDTTKDPLKNLVRMDDLYTDPDVAEDDVSAEAPEVMNNGKVEYVFNDSAKNREIHLIYQRSYATISEDDEGAMANLVEQIPDIVLKIVDKSNKDGGKDLEYTYIFDAKYRVRIDGVYDCAKNETINDMHRYRDAILYRRSQQPGGERIKREAIGAYILYPGRAGQSKDYSRFINEENIGAIALLPKRYQRDANGKMVLDHATQAPIPCPTHNDGEQALRIFINDILSRSNPSDHLGINRGGFSNVIPTRGTTVVVGEGDRAVLGYMAIAKNFEGGLTAWVRKTHYFPLPAGQCEHPELVRILVIPSTGNSNLFEVEEYCTKTGAIAKARVEALYNCEGKAPKFDLPYNAQKELKPKGYIGYKEGDQDGFLVWKVKPIQSVSAK